VDNTGIPILWSPKSIDPKLALSNISLRISGHFLGETDLKILVNQSLNGTIKGDDPSWVEYIDAYNVIVTRESRPIDTAFTVSIIILVCIANIAMGCKTDIGVVKATLKKPIAPLTGLASQFLKFLNLFLRENVQIFLNLYCSVCFLV
jgi:sodium/bile acid cotransporter 3/5